MNSNFQEHIIAILKESPNGLTSNEIAKRLGATTGNISSRLSKLAAYGIIGKSRYNPGGNVYRALTYERRCGNGMAARGAGTAVARRIGILVGAGNDSQSQAWIARFRQKLQQPRSPGAISQCFRLELRERERNV